MPDQTFNIKDIARDARVHYDESKAELDVRITHSKQGFDGYDMLYRSQIDPATWPYNAKVFIPLVFKSLYGKGSRLVTGKVKGTLVAGPGGNELGAKVGTELLSAQYDDHDFYNNESMIKKIFRLDQNARKYGAGVALVPWMYRKHEGKVEFDGPTLEVLDNRRVMFQPGAKSIDDSLYVMVERVRSLQDMHDTVNVGENLAREYTYSKLKELERVAESVAKEDPNRADSINTIIRGLSGSRTGYGNDREFIVVTAYYDDKWVSWTPDTGSIGEEPGLILSVKKNPYDHRRKPFVLHEYIPIDDDIYGASGIESVRSEQLAINALSSLFIESSETSLYPIVHGHKTNVDWNTIEYKPKAAWIMNNPGTDIVPHTNDTQFTKVFVEAYRMLSSSFSEGMGETAQDSSNMSAFQADKTATEVKDLAFQRGSRDNLEKLFMAGTLTRIFGMWWSMDKQFLTSKKIINIVGSDALRYFIDEGLDGYTLADEGFRFLENWMEENPGLPFDEAYESLREAGVLDAYSEPLYPVAINGEQLPKLQLAKGGKSGFLAVEPKDLSGEYRFQLDLNTISAKSPESEAASLSMYYDKMHEAMPALLEEGYKMKHKELLETIGDKLDIKNAEQYFEKMDPRELEQMKMQGAGQMPQDPNMVQSPQGPPGPQQLIGQQLNGQVQTNQQPVRA